MKITAMIIICMFLVMSFTGSSAFQLPCKDWLSPGMPLNELMPLTYQTNSRLWVSINQPAWFALGRAFYVDEKPILYGIALFHRDGRLIWSTSIPYHCDFYSLPLNFSVQSVPVSILDEDYPVTVGYLQQKYGDFFDVLGDVALSPCYLLRDGRILYLKIQNTSADINPNDQVMPYMIESPGTHGYFFP